LVTAIVAKNIRQTSTLGLPTDLLNFRNVNHFKSIEIVSVKDTSLAKEVKFSCEVERLNAIGGNVVVEGVTYKYEVQSNINNILTVVVNGQLRKQEYFVENSMVHVFNHEGDQFGFRF
jgi:hypothetical protein